MDFWKQALKLRAKGAISPNLYCILHLDTQWFSINFKKIIFFNNSRLQFIIRTKNSREDSRTFILISMIGLQSFQFVTTETRSVLLWILFTILYKIDQ